MRRQESYTNQGLTSLSIQLRTVLSTEGVQKRPRSSCLAPASSPAEFLSVINLSLKNKALTECWVACSQSSPQKMCKRPEDVHSTLEGPGKTFRRAQDRGRNRPKTQGAYNLRKERKLFQINGLNPTQAACSQFYPQKM